MNKEDILKQRKIGQQIMLVRIILGENDRALRTGLPSWIEKDNVSQWAGISKEELNDLIDDISLLFDNNLIIDSSIEYARAKKLSGNEKNFFHITFMKHGFHYISEKIGMRKAFSESGEKELTSVYADNIEGVADRNASSILAIHGVTVNDEMKSAESFKASLEFYFDFYINRVVYLLNRGYDWDVVCEMIGEDKEFTDLLKKYIDSCEDK
jgi:hypothetical protein